jgi:phosphoribosylglycinamide formyltransferase-1
MGRTVPLGVLISGSGTNLQAIMDAVSEKRLDAAIGVVLSNRPDAQGLARARSRGIPTEVVEHRKFPTREDFDRELVRLLKSYGAELVILAGFMRLLSPVLIRAFPDRIMNIHPALLPAFPGLHAQRQALEHGVRFSGCTVHFVSEECDQGAIIIQAVVPVLPGDTEETLSARILGEEHRIYPRAIQLYAEGRLKVSGRHVRVDGSPQPEAGVLVCPPLKG